MYIISFEDFSDGDKCKTIKTRKVDDNLFAYIWYSRKTVNTHPNFLHLLDR